MTLARTTRPRTAAAILALTLALPGCGALSALSGGPALDVFELRAPDETPKSCGRGRRAELVVEEPKARGTLDTERIMIRPNALQTQYLPDAQWGDTVPVTLQNLLVRSFSPYDAFTHVGRAPLGTAGDFALISEIRDFNAEVAGKGAIVRLSVDAQLVREMDASVTARRQAGRVRAAWPGVLLALRRRDVTAWRGPCNRAAVLSARGRVHPHAAQAPVRHLPQQFAPGGIEGRDQVRGPCAGRGGGGSGVGLGAQDRGLPDPAG